MTDLFDPVKPHGTFTLKDGAGIQAPGLPDDHSPRGREDRREAYLNITYRLRNPTPGREGAREDWCGKRSTPRAEANRAGGPDRVQRVLVAARVRQLPA